MQDALPSLGYPEGDGYGTQMLSHCDVTSDREGSADASMEACVGLGIAVHRRDYSDCFGAASATRLVASIDDWRLRTPTVILRNGPRAGPGYHPLARRRGRKLRMCYGRQTGCLQPTGTFQSLSQSMHPLPALCGWAEPLIGYGIARFARYRIAECVIPLQKMICAAGAGDGQRPHPPGRPGRRPPALPKGTSP